MNENRTNSASQTKGHKIGFCDGRTFEFTNWTNEIEKIKGLDVTDSTKINAALNMANLKKGQCMVLANVIGSERLNTEILEEGCDDVFLEAIRKVFNELAEPTGDTVYNVVEEVL